MIKTTIAAITAATIASSATAQMTQDPFSSIVPPVYSATKEGPQFGVNIGASTLGMTIEPTLRINRHFGVRVPFGSSDFSSDYTDGDTTYDGKVNLGGRGLMADFYPIGGGFHVSAGVFDTDYSADLVARDVDMGGTSADFDVALRQKEEISPALAMGYEGRFGDHFTISTTAGAMFGEGFDLTVTDPNGTFSQSAIDAEFEDARDFAEGLQVVPYLKMMVGFRF